MLMPIEVEIIARTEAALIFQDEVFLKDKTNFSLDRFIPLLQANLRPKEN